MELKRSLVVQSADEREGRIREGVYPHSVHQKKCEGRSEGHSLVPVDERVVLSQALPQRGCLLDQVRIVARLGTKERRFQQSGISHSRRSAVAFDLVSVNGQDFGHREEVRHSASFL